MDILQRNVPVTMIRENLDRLPHYPLPAPFALRWYQPGDERHWLRIHALADPYNTVTGELYQREFGLDAGVLGRRQAFLVDGQGQVFGTATAWWDDGFAGAGGGGRYGRLHWVAILPEMQGRGLAKPLLSVVCERMKALGDERAYLTTSTARIAAINLYAHFGFVPEIRSEDEAAAWRELQLIIRVPWRLTG